MARRKRNIESNGITHEIEREFLNFDEAFDKYLSFQLLKNDRYNTLKTTRNLLENFKKFVETEFPSLLEDIGEVKPEHIEIYVGWCENVLKNRTTTINRKIRNLKSFFSFLKKKKIIFESPVDVVPMKIVDKKPKVIVTRELLERAIKGMNKKSFTDMRTISVAYILFNTGLRIGELQTLQLENVDLDKKEIILDRSKNRNFRKIPLNKEAEKYFRIWLKIRGELDHDFVFINELNEPISKRTLQNTVKRMFENIGRNDVTCHSLRKGFITSLVDKGVPLPTIASIVGHSSLDEILTYVKTSEDELHKAVRNI